MSILAERIRERLEATGQSARAASMGAGLSGDAIRNILSGKSGSPKVSTLLALAAQLDTSLPYLMGKTDDQPSRPNMAHAQFIDLPVAHEVAAGPWLAPDDQADFEPEILTVQSIPGFEHYPQWLELVRGDSFNRLIGDGSFVHVVDAAALGYRPRTGDVVVVTRSRAQGSLVERTLKEVEVTSGGVKLWPRSHNPRWSEPLSITAGLEDHEDDVEVRVVGRVLRSFMDFGVQARNRSTR